ncbi:MAG: hypothetical protein AVDCRST_MAG89-4182, partial [uncultured Gemmatimonadetes bacterium]
ESREGGARTGRASGPCRAFRCSSSGFTRSWGGDASDM